MALPKTNTPKWSRKRSRKSSTKDVQGVINVAYSTLLNNAEPPEELTGDLAFLEKQRDLAAARYVYAISRESYWKTQIYYRSQKLNSSIVAYTRKKHGFTDEELQSDQSTGTSVWSYSK